MNGAPLLVLGLLVTLSALLGARVTARAPGGIARFLLSPLHPATWYATAAILAGFLIEVVAFGLILGAFSAGASTLIVGVGVVIVGLAIEGARIVARVERARATWADPRPLRAHPYRPYGTGLRDLLVALFLDVARWRDVAYVLVAFPLSVLEFAAVVALWGTSIILLSLPLLELTSGLRFVVPLAAGSESVVALAGGLAGLVLAPVAATVSQWLMALHRIVAAGFLCESEQRALERRVRTLEVSRQAVLDVEASELRRIERDLHDGAQQHLVLLTINLGLAAERIDTDPAAAKGLVVEARDQARQALAELRDLVRGIAPAILLDRGLVPALSAIAGRSPVPTVVTSELPDGLRLPDAVERAAYFVVAEALANVAKHASAARCTVRCRSENGRLVVEVEDDGSGGARLVPGGGLTGLAGRVEALDGTLAVSSPAGGPTIIRAELPVPAGPAWGPVATGWGPAATGWGPAGGRPPGRVATGGPPARTPEPAPSAMASADPPGPEPPSAEAAPTPPPPRPEPPSAG